MTAEIISVGTELLLGNILNTNAQYLSRELADLGITVQRESTIGDNHGRLADFVNEAKSRCDLLVFTGGLGPTADDLTKETVAACFGDELAFDEAEWDKITSYFARTGRETTPTTANRRWSPPRAIKSSTTTALPRRVVRTGRPLRRPHARCPPRDESHVDGERPPSADGAPELHSPLRHPPCAGRRERY